MKFEWVHIALIIIGAIVYINGMFVAVGLGVILYKEADSNIGRCTMYIVLYVNVYHRVSIDSLCRDSADMSISS